MLEVKCVNKLRDKNGVIYGYTIEDAQGKHMNVQADALKNAIRTKQCNCINLLLTNDNRLIDNVSIDKENKTLNIKNFNPSIFGVSVKNIKESRGREGMFYSADVYYQGKKLGFWTQSSIEEISDWFDFNVNIIKESINKYSIYKNTTNNSPEKFMSDLVILTDYFKLYKKTLARGNNHMIVVTDDYDINVIAFGVINAFDANGNILSFVSDEINKNIQSINQDRYGKPIVKIFKSLNDFIIK